MNIRERFIKYTSFFTTSNSKNEACPSTEGQRTFANYLAAELSAIGLSDITIDENAYLMATLPSNIEQKVPTIGFISHLDTSPDMTGENVQARIVSKYDGKDILLNAEENIILSPTQFPELELYIGQDLVVTNGKTLLGADDKAGVAEIVSAMEYLVQHPEIKHGTIRICFTPDEEVGRGAHLFDVENFGAEWAYTIDGGQIGELEYENFNAAGAEIIFKGRSVHPGNAKDKMVNSMHMAHAFMAMLPADEVPEKTCDYEGFYHLINMNGTVEETTLNYIIRDHDREKFEARKLIFKELAENCGAKFGAEGVTVTIKDQYYNMREKVEPVMHIVDLAEQAMKNVGVTPIIKPIRGGTDGSQLSYKGLPCPNIFAGGHNFHGKYEYVPVQSMEKAVEVIVEICKINAEKN